MPKLYLVHCGFYDTAICDGLYESHVNFMIAADSFEDARLRAKELPEVKAKKMHVDGMQEIEAVSGYRVRLEEEPALAGLTILHSHKKRELAPASATPSSQVQGSL